MGQGAERARKPILYTGQHNSQMIRERLTVQVRLSATQTSRYHSPDSSPRTRACVAAIAAGEKCCERCQRDGLRARGVAPGGFAHQIAGTAEVTPVGGGPSLVQELATVKDLRARRLREYYVDYRRTVPAELPPGQYTMRVTLREPGTGRSASRTLGFSIVPEPEGVAATPRDAAPAP